MNRDLFATERFEKEVLVSEFLSKCVDFHTFENYCKQCSNYGKTWSCPSYDFNPLDFWNQYQYLTIYGFKIKVPKELRALEYPQKLKDEFADMILTEWKQMIDDEMLTMEKKVTPSIAVSSGVCLRCNQEGCSRLNGQPCRHPEKMRYSMEALGGDVEKAALLYLNQKLLWMKDGRLPEYFMMVGGLLHNEKLTKK